LSQWKIERKKERKYWVNGRERKKYWGSGRERERDREHENVEGVEEREREREIWSEWKRERERERNIHWESGRERKRERERENISYFKIISLLQKFKWSRMSSNKVVSLPPWFESWWVDEAVLEAERGQEEGGIPIGSVLVDPEGQDGDRWTCFNIEGAIKKHITMEEHVIDTNAGKQLA
jgi:hypothetical protein